MAIAVAFGKVQLGHHVDAAGTGMRRDGAQLRHRHAVGAPQFRMRSIPHPVGAIEHQQIHPGVGHGIDDPHGGIGVERRFRLLRPAPGGVVVTRVHQKPPDSETVIAHVSRLPAPFHSSVSGNFSINSPISRRTVSNAVASGTRLPRSGSPQRRRACLARSDGAFGAMARFFKTAR